MPFGPGDVLAGRYRVEGILASGGMGVVYTGRHLMLDERVAIKCLLPELSTDGEQVARLLREAQATAKIRSEHVARVLDADRLPDGTVFLAMEYLEGADLSTVLEKRGQLGTEEAVSYVLQAGEALAEAHALGIVHRDLKPANLFAAKMPDGRVSIKILDFGISKILHPHAVQARTRTGTVLGTPLYASPEQLTNPTDVDARADVWSLGCVLYELLAGVPPFEGETIGALVAAILSAPPLPLSAKRRDLPDGLELVVARCLEKDRTRRWQSIGELAQALVPFAPAQAEISTPRISALSSGPQRTALPFAATERGPSLPPAPISSPRSGAGASQARTAAAWDADSRSLRQPQRAAGTWVASGLIVAAGLALLFMAVRPMLRPRTIEPPDTPAASAPLEPSIPSATSIMGDASAPLSPRASAPIPRPPASSVRPSRSPTPASRSSTNDGWNLPLK